MTRTKKPIQAGNAAFVPTGSAASIGKAGTAPSAEPEGETAVPIAEREARAEHVGDRPDDRVRQVAQAGEQQQRRAAEARVERGDGGLVRVQVDHERRGGEQRAGDGEQRERRERAEDQRTRPRRHPHRELAPRREPAGRAETAGEQRDAGIPP